MVKQQEMSSLKSASSPTDHSSGGVKFRGVRKRKWGKYVSEIRLPNSRERIWLGSYDTPEKAARAFDAALFCLRGNTAKFNFPDQPPHIPGGRSLLPSQIQAAAARFANHNSDIKSSSVKCPTTTTTTTDDNSSNSSSSCNSSEEEDSPSLCMFQLTDLSETWTSTFLENDLTSSSSSYMNIIDTDIITNTDIGVPDFEIFPGFDDYLMTTPPTTDYGEENCDGVYLQDPSFLWNF